MNQFPYQKNKKNKHVHYTLGQNKMRDPFSSSWWFQPIRKICSSNWIISPGKGENKTYLSCHHLVMFFPLDACRFFPTNDQHFPVFCGQNSVNSGLLKSPQGKELALAMQQLNHRDSSQGISHLGEITILLDFFFNHHFHTFLIRSSLEKTRHKDVCGFC